MDQTHHGNLLVFHYFSSGIVISKNFSIIMLLKYYICQFQTSPFTSGESRQQEHKNSCSFNDDLARLGTFLRLCT